MTLFHSSRVVSRNGTGEVMPAMLASAPTGGRLPEATSAATASLSGGHRVLGGDVDGVAEGGNGELVADLGGDLRRLLAVEVEDHDGPAFAGVALGDGHADAAVGGGAGDDGGALWCSVMVFLLQMSVGNQYEPALAARGGPFVVGDVAGFEFQREVARDSRRPRGP